MSTPQQETTPKIIKICPGCAMTQFSNYQKEGDTDDQKVITADKHNRLDHGLTLCKQLCGVTDVVTIWRLLLLAFELLVSCSSALKHLAFAMLPVMKYFALLLLYSVDGILCILQEKRLWMKGLKGLVLAASVVVLSYFAYTLLSTYVIPVFNLFSAILSRAISIL